LPELTVCNLLVSTVYAVCPGRADRPVHLGTMLPCTERVNKECTEEVVNLLTRKTEERLEHPPLEDPRGAFLLRRFSIVLDSDELEREDLASFLTRLLACAVAERKIGSRTQGHGRRLRPHSIGI
jgi:hypothetical protein